MLVGATGQMSIATAVISNINYNAVTSFIPFNMIASFSLVLGGKTRALAVTGSERAPLLPNVPSMAEAGYPEVNTHLWSGFFLPAGAPNRS